jgi:transcriptional regulator with XRE-family HTH domain
MVGVAAETFQGWEYGEGVPSLPQLEILAFYLGVPVSHFWSQNTLREEYEGERRSEKDYMQLRTRMVGVLLRQAREEAGMTVEELAEDARLAAEDIKQYEMGDKTIPMHELTVMARSVNKTMDYFLDSSGMIGELLATREEWKHFSELPDDVRAFAANPVNIGFIEIAIMLSQMPTEKLRRVGSSIVDITM